MKVFIVLAAVACIASAGLIGAPSHLVRTPQFDSAVIKSDRLGGNFAYSTAEHHAFAAVSPVIQHVATPVAVSYSAPAVYAAPQYAFAAPVLAQQPIIAHHNPFVVAHAPAVVSPVVADAIPAEAAPAPAPAPAQPAPAADDSVSVEAA